MTKPVLILTGSPGSGKTSVAGVLAQRFSRSVHIEADVFWHFIKGGYTEPWKGEAQQQNEVVMDAVAKAAATYANAGYFTVIDAIVGPSWFLVPLTEALQSEGLTVAYAVLQVPLEVAVARATSRPSTPLKKVPAIEHLWREFSELGPLSTHAVAVGDRSPEEVAAEVEWLLESRQLVVTRR